MFGILNGGIKFVEAVSETAESVTTVADTVADTATTVSEAADTGKGIWDMTKSVAKNPITIGIAATAAAGAGIYYGWKAYKKYKSEHPKSEIHAESVNSKEDLKNAEEIKVEPSSDSAK